MYFLFLAGSKEYFWLLFGVNGLGGLRKGARPFDRWKQ